MRVLLILLTCFFGAAALLYAWVIYRKVEAFEVKDEKITRLSNIIHRGAFTFLKKEYTWVAIFVGIVSVLFLPTLGFSYSLSFVWGVACTAGAGWLGMHVATRSNGRTAYAAATKGTSEALDMAFSGGSVAGMLVVGIGLLCVSIAYLLLGANPAPLAAVGMGISSLALFARVGGGIYTKAADVGADLVGKVESNIPEDDPRNPAVIADNVGDNVGDVAGMSADLMESYANAIIAAMIVGFLSMDLSVGGEALGLRGVAFPLLLAAWGIVSSISGCLVVSPNALSNTQVGPFHVGRFIDRTFSVAEKVPFIKTMMDRIRSGDAAFALRAGLFAAGLKMIVGTFFLSLIFFFWYTFHIFFAVSFGVLAAVAIGFATEYFTSSDYSPTKVIAQSSETGSATIILSGISSGMKSVVVPVLLICFAIWASFSLAGIFGVACAAVGMLSITGIALSVDAYGPISDNAGGIAQMTKLPPEVRQITDKLDAIGNTTAAMGKGLAVASAALTALALFIAYAQAVQIEVIDLLNANVITGMLLGGMLPFLFCALAIEAVSRAAQAMIEEVRRQFREIVGLMDGTGEADHEKCISISTEAALREMIIPGAIALFSPVIVGLVLGKEALGGFLAGSIVTGVMLALFMANAGGAWDNAKKYIEEGHHGGKNTPNHAAAVVGDTVGDPFKDTAGPCLNNLIKLMAMVALVIAPIL